MDYPDRKSRWKYWNSPHFRTSGVNDIYRTLHLIVAEYIFFLCAHGIFSRIDHMIGKEVLTNLRRLKSY